MDRRKFLTAAAAITLLPAIPQPIALGQTRMDLCDAIKKAKNIWGQHAFVAFTEPEYDTNNGARFRVGIDDGSNCQTFYGDSWEDAFVTYQILKADKKYRKMLGDTEFLRRVYG